MSILDTFYFLFDADASKLDKGLKEADKGNKQLTDGLLKTDEVAKKLGENFVDIIKSGVTAATALLATHAIKEMAEQSAELTDETRKAAKAAFKGVEDYDAFAKATVAAGGSADALGSTLKELGMRTQTPLNYLLRLSNTFKGMSDKRAMRLAGWLGLDAGIVPLLQQGEQGIRNLIKRQLELGIVTKEQADTAKLYKDQLRDTNQVFDDIKRRIATAILPYMTEFLHIMERTFIWLRDNKGIVLAFFAAVGGIITAIYLPAMIRAVAATMALLGPYLLIGAAIAAVASVFALAYDDVMNFLKGNNSVIGELSKKWPIIGVIVKAIAAAVEYLGDICGTVFKFIAEAFTKGPGEAWDDLVQAFDTGTDAIGAKFPWLAAIIRAFAEPIKWAVGMVREHWDQISEVIGAAADVFKFFFDLLTSGLQFIAELITDGPEQAFHNLGVRTQQILDDLAKKFPFLADAINFIKGPIMAVADALGEGFKEFGDIVNTVIEYALKAAHKVMEVVGKIKDFFSSDDKPQEIEVKAPAAISKRVAMNDDDGEALAKAIAGREGTPERQKELQDALSQGKQQMAQTQTPLNSMTSNTIANSTRSVDKTTNVTVQEVNVQTASTDPDAVGNAISNGLGDHIKGAIDQFDDGVAA